MSMYLNRQKKIEALKKIVAGTATVNSLSDIIPKPCKKFDFVRVSPIVRREAGDGKPLNVDPAELFRLRLTGNVYTYKEIASLYKNHKLLVYHVASDYRDSPIIGISKMFIMSPAELSEFERLIRKEPINKIQA